MQLRRSDVVDGALVILDEYGLADLSMRRLAGSLGVAPGALYWHVANKQALLGAVSDRILSRLDAAVDTRPQWDDEVRALAHRLRDALLSHRDGAEVVASSLSARTVTHPIGSTLARELASAGLSSEDATDAADALLYYVLGATMDEQSRMQMESVGALPFENRMPPENYASAGHLTSVVRDPTARFDFGLGLVIDGVRHRVRTLQE